MTKHLFYTAAVFLSLSSAASAFTIQWNSGSVKATGFDNTAGNATGGLNFGIVIDTNNNGFSGLGLNYDGFTMPAAGASTFLSKGSDASLTDDLFYWNGTTTLATITGTDGGTNGLPTSFALTGITVGTTSNVTSGDPFGIIWFNNASTADGAKYGFFTHSSFLIGNQPDTTNFSAAFPGVDTPRLASNTLGTIAPIPEPSRALLLGLGVVGMVIRRRRA